MTEPDNSLLSEADEAAGRVRSQLDAGGGPLDLDLLESVETGLGIPVTVMRLPAPVAGAYIRKRSRGFIFLRADDPPTRQRFTLAHEVGHHVLGHTPRIEDSKDVFGTPSDPQEAQANRFAGEFLAPIESIKDRIESVGSTQALDLTGLVLLASQFHMSTPAMLYRLGAPEFSDQVDTQDLWNRCRRSEHKKVERALGIGYGDDQLAQLGAIQKWPRLPAQLVADAKKARDTGFIDEERFREVMRVS